MYLQKTFRLLFWADKQGLIKNHSGCFLLYLDKDQKRQAIWMISEETGIKLIGAARHMLLNDLQLIKGYIYMNQMEHANEVISRLTDRLIHQAHLSHLQMPKSSFFLVTSSWFPHPYRLSYSVSGPERNLSECDESLHAFLNLLIQKLDQHASEFTDNTVHIELEAVPAHVYLHVTFEGQLCDAETMMDEMKKTDLNQSLRWVEHYLTKGKSDNEMRWILCLLIR